MTKLVKMTIQHPKTIGKRNMSKLSYLLQEDRKDQTETAFKLLIYESPTPRTHYAQKSAIVQTQRL